MALRVSGVTEAVETPPVSGISYPMLIASSVLSPFRSALIQGVAFMSMFLYKDGMLGVACLS